ncbi:DUF5931 domain-containing protein [Nonomuraea dietziae]|uniref:DUF5931 domain-containing protein n=1 Tax=Nonomuraea dietziae TaxID=65515 RepID=UPI0031DD8AA2
MTIEGPFWRAIAVFRVASLVYAGVLMAQHEGFAEPLTGWVVIAVMALWTAASTFAYSVRALRGRPLLVIDMLVTLACLLATPYVQGQFQGQLGSMPVPAIWVASPVLAWAVYGGRRLGAVAAAIVAVADLWVRVNGPDSPVLLNGAVLLFMAGIVVGHVARLAKQAEERMQRAAEMEAAQRERERLARGIHDSVLQVLALVQRRGQEIGGEAARARQARRAAGGGAARAARRPPRADGLGRSAGAAHEARLRPGHGLHPGHPHRPARQRGRGGGGGRAGGAGQRAGALRAGGEGVGLRGGGGG